MLSDNAYAIIRRLIIEGSIAPSSRISEPELSSRLALGTAAVRAALARLAQEGLVSPIPRKGYMVSPLTIEGAREILDIRIALESRAAYLAAGRISSEELQKIRAHFATGYRIDDRKSIDKMLSWNSRFRKMIAQASGNSRLAALINQLVDEMERYLRLSWEVENRSQSLLGGFDELIEALVNGKAQEAKNLVEKQISRTARNVLGSLIRRPEIQGATLVAPPLPVRRH